MGRPKKGIQPGDVGWICGNEINGVRFKSPIQVEVLSVDSGSMHPIKVRTKAGRIYYISEEELQKRASKAEKKPADLIVPEDVKKEAEIMAEKRIETLLTSGELTMTKTEIRTEAVHKLPSFQDIKRKFYSIRAIGLSGAEGAELVADLAEKALFEEIKNGCTWSGD